MEDLCFCFFNQKRSKDENSAAGFIVKNPQTLRSDIIKVIYTLCASFATEKNCTVKSPIPEIC